MPLDLFLDVWLNVRTQATVGDEVDLEAELVFQVFTKPHEVFEGRILGLFHQIDEMTFHLLPRLAQRDSASSLSGKNGDAAIREREAHRQT